MRGPGLGSTLLLIGCAFLPATGSSAAWRASTSFEEPAAFQVIGVVPLGDLGILLQLSGQASARLQFNALGDGVGVIETLPHWTPFMAVSGKRLVTVDRQRYLQEPTCRVRRGDTGLPRYHVEIGEWVPAPVVLADGIVAVPGDQAEGLRMFRDDCQAEAVDIGAGLPLLLEAAIERRAAYAVVWDPNGGTPGPNHLRRIDHSGVQWSVPLGQFTLPRYGDSLHATADGGVLLLNGAVLTKFDADGRRRWQAALPGFGPDSGARLGDDDRGPFAILTSLFTYVLGLPQQLVRLAADDGAMQTHVLDPHASIGGPLNGTRDLLTLLPRDDTPAATHIVRIGPDAVPQVEWVAPPGRSVHARLADGRFAASVASSPHHVELLDPATGAAEVLELPVLPHPGMRFDQHIDGDGVFTLVAAMHGHRYLAHHALDDGRLRWQRMLPGSGLATHDVFAVGAEAACVWRDWFDDSALRCVHRDSGAPYADWQPVPMANSSPLLRIDDAGVTTISASCDEVACGLWRRRFDFEGTLLAETVLFEGSGALLVSPAGHLIAVDEHQTRTHVFDADARSLGSTALPAGHHSIALADDRSLLRLADAADSNSESSLEAYDSQGELRWRIAHPAGQFERHQALALPGGDWLLLSQELWREETATDAEGHTFPVLHRVPDLISVMRLDGGTGERRWTRRLQVGGAVEFAVDAVDALIYLHEQHPGGRVTALRIDDGAIDAAFASDARPQFPTPSRLGTSAALQLLPGRGPLLSWLDAEHGALHLQAIDRAASLDGAPATALRGIWHSDATLGQGLLVDVIDDGAFAGWFTFDRDGGHRHAALNWFVLQGARSASGDAFEMTIYRAAGGVFAEGAAVDAEAVGQAILRSSGCGRALLIYQFDADADEAARSGAIPLRRTVGDSGACGDRPAPSTTDPRQAVAGAWHEPSRSGQGLLLETIARDGAPPLVAGAWFTFDPPGQADDALAQHWFTVLGAFDASDPNRASLSLYRTTGGAFDRDWTDSSWSIGTIELHFDGCDVAQLHYRFDDAPLAGAFAGASGTIALRRITACRQ